MRRVGSQQGRRAFQRHGGAGFATGMRELNSDRSLLIVIKRDDLAQSGYMTLLVNPEAARCDAAIARDG